MQPWLGRLGGLSLRDSGVKHVSGSVGSWDLTPNRTPFSPRPPGRLLLAFSLYLSLLSPSAPSSCFYSLLTLSSSPPPSCSLGASKLCRSPSRQEFVRPQNCCARFWSAPIFLGKEHWKHRRALALPAHPRPRLAEDRWVHSQRGWHFSGEEQRSRGTPIAPAVGLGDLGWRCAAALGKVVRVVALWNFSDVVRCCGLKPFVMRAGGVNSRGAPKALGLMPPTRTRRRVESERSRREPAGRSEESLGLGDLREAGSAGHEPRFPPPARPWRFHPSGRVARLGSYWAPRVS